MSPLERLNSRTTVVRNTIGAILLSVSLAGISIVLNKIGSEEPTVSTPAEAKEQKFEPSRGNAHPLFSRYIVRSEQGGPLPLGDGEYLVALLSMSCDHCMASVPRLNEYVGLFPEIPVVALCWEPAEGAMAEFAAQSGPMFPMHSLGDDFLEFSELIGSAPPRLSFVRDGVAVKSWDDSMPEVEELAAAVEALKTQ